jgi:hypothetical protein
VCAASGRASLRSVGACGRGERAAVRAALRRPASGDGRAACAHQTAREYVNERGETVRTMEHRAGWDATFSAPEVCLSDGACWRRRPRARGAQESVRSRSTRWRKYVQARIGGNARRRRRAHGPSPSSSMTAAARRWLRRAAAAHARGDLQCDRNGGRQTRGRCSRRNFTRRSSTRRRSIARSWRRGCSGWATRSSAASMGSRRSRATRASIWRRRVRGGSRSKSTWKSRAQRRWSRADRGASDARCEAAALARRGAGAASETGRRAWKSAAAGDPRSARPGVELKPEQSRSRRAEGMSYARERGMEREAVTTSVR